MTRVSMAKKRFARGAAALLFVIVGFLSGPGFAAAATQLPIQVIPPATGKSCPAVTFSQIQAHVYDSSLDSFDVTLSDSTYVAVYASVGGAPIGLNYLTRWKNADGSMRTHADLQRTVLDRDTRIQITFLSAHLDESGRQVTCVLDVPTIVPAEQHINEYPTPPAGGATPNTPSVPTPNQGSQSGTGASTTASSTNPGLVAAMNSLGNLCADGGATRLWVVLLVLFTLFVFTLCAQKLEAAPSARDWNIGLILVVFVGLLIFWYVSAVCRTGPWAPAIATFITIVGLLYTMLKGDDTQEILLLKDGEK